MADKELLDLIAGDRAHGKSDDSIRKNLLENGWSPEDVNGAFASLFMRNSTLGVVDGLNTQGVPELKRPSTTVAWILILIIILAPCTAYGLHRYGTVVKQFVSDTLSPLQ